MSMQDAVAAVCGLTRKGQPSTLAVKLRTPVNKFLDALRSFFYQDARCIGIHNSVPGLNSVLQVQADFVFIAQRDGDSALCVLRIGFGQLLFGQYQYFARFR